MTTHDITSDIQSAMSSEPAPEEELKEVSDTSSRQNAEEPQTQEEPQKEESFLGDVDPDKLSETELRELARSKFKPWQSKYTQTRQQERAELRRLQEENEALRTSREAPITNVREAQERTITKSPEEILKMTPEEHAEYVAELAYQKHQLKIQEAEQKLKVERSESYQNNMINDFFSADSRFDQDNPDFDPQMTRIVHRNVSDILDEYIQQNGTAEGFDYKSIIQSEIKAFDDLIDARLQGRVQSSNTKTRERIDRYGRSSSLGGNAPVVAKESSVEDIVRDAVREHM